MFTLKIRQMKKNIYKLGLAFVALMVISVSTFAQKDSRNFKNKKSECISERCTPEQKEQMKQIRISFAEETIASENELNELIAAQKTLLSFQNPNKNEVDSNIDKMANLKFDILKSKVKMHLAMKDIVGDKAICKKDKACNKGREGFHKKGDRRGMHTNKSEKMHKGKKHARMSSMLDLSDDQKAKMKELKVKFEKETRSVQNSLEELQLRQKHLMKNDAVDISAIHSNMEKSKVLRTQLAKKKVELKIECNKILTKEQFLLKESAPNKKRHHKRG